MAASLTLRRVGDGRAAGRRLADLARGPRGSSPAPHDDGAVHDHRHRRGGGDRGALHRARDRALRPGGRGAGRAHGRPRAQAIKQLVYLLPRLALVRRGGAEREVSADDLQVGEIILVKPGARIPIDGIVAGGHSFVDQATITGESMPVEKLAGDQVFAGTINQSGALEIRTTGIGRDTAFGRIIEAVERAEQSRAPIEKTADRLAGYLVYFALACAGFTFLVTRDARATISVIIVAGACGIAAGTPLAILGGLGRAARI